MSRYESWCAEIIAQTALLTSVVRTVDLTTPVPSCPGWNVGQLVRHLGGGQRWAETAVRTRAASPPPDDHFRDLSRYTDEDPVALADWLADSAAGLADTLRAAGPDATMWTPVAGGSSSFYARRFTHETVIHRADATLAVGRDFDLDHDVAIDAVDEWMELGSLPEMFDFYPERRELLGPGRTLHFHATDTPAEWVVDLTRDVLAWRRAHEKSAVAVRAPLTDLLLLIYRRRSVAGLEILGDVKLLDFLLERLAFG
ncbi:MAG TPA: maleylpyruvate isomerase family mycothiol-dependent enzyme [Actinoplanes sp.]|jgi:uncharacterized protein (TIGR03083 family)